MQEIKPSKEDGSEYFFNFYMEKNFLSLKTVEETTKIKINKLSYINI